MFTETPRAIHLTLACVCMGLQRQCHRLVKVWKDLRWILHGPSVNLCAFKSHQTTSAVTQSCICPTVGHGIAYVEYGCHRVKRTSAKMLWLRYISMPPGGRLDTSSFWQVYSCSSDEHIYPVIHYIHHIYPPPLSSQLLKITIFQWPKKERKKEKKTLEMNPFLISQSHSLLTKAGAEALSSMIGARMMKSEYMRVSAIIRR